MNNELIMYALLILLSIIILILMIFIVFIVQLKNQNNNLKESLEKYKDQNLKQSYELKNEINNELLETKIHIFDNLIKFNDNLSRNLKEDFNNLNETTVERLINIENHMNQSLINNYNQTQKIIVSMTERMTKIDETQKSLKDLSSDILSLQGILQDKKVRGIFGEIELYSLLENVFGPNNERFKKQYKLSNGNIADAVIIANEPLNNIVIDSKFPLENYNRIYDEKLSKNEREAARNLFGKDVIKHINDIANKYLIPNETAEIAYMFIPSEAIFAEIYGSFNDVVNLSYDKHVYIVSPTTLMAYLTAIKSIYIGYKRDENIKLIREEYIKLSVEFNRYIERFSRINNDFERLYKDFKDINITNDKLQRRFNEINSLKIIDEVNHD